MTDFAFHENTKKAVDGFVARPSHALILLGSTGAGKETIARYVVSTILDTSLENLETYPYFTVIESVDGKAIGIEDIRKLQHVASLKIPRVGALTRFVIIKDAQHMTQEAQNALLKLVEEPPEATLIVLTVAAQHMLLPTISSRCQCITVYPLQEPVATEYFTNQGYTTTQLQRAWLISGGLTGLMSALLVEDNGHPLVRAATTARQLLQGSPFERLLLVDTLSKQSSNDTRDVLLVLQQMARVALERSAAAATARWQAVLQSSYDTIAALDKGAQIKLALTNLMLNL